MSPHQYTGDVMSNEVSQMNRATFSGTRGIPAKHQLNLPSIYQQLLGQRVWDFNSPRSWHIDTILKLIWSPERQSRTYNTAQFVAEQILKNQYSTRTELRVKAEVFPAELAKAVEKAKKETTALIEGQAKQKAELLAKEVEGREKVAELKIKTLESAIAKQATQIESLSKQLNNATSQVQNIAIRAIEGASGVKALSAVNEIALEQAKNVGAKK